MTEQLSSHPYALAKKSLKPTHAVSLSMQPSQPLSRTSPVVPLLHSVESDLVTDGTDGRLKGHELEHARGCPLAVIDQYRSRRVRLNILMKSERWCRVRQHNLSHCQAP